MDDELDSRSTLQVNPSLQVKVTRHISVQGRKRDISADMLVIHTNAGHRVQSGLLWFLANKFLVRSIHRSPGARLWTKKRSTLVHDHFGNSKNQSINNTTLNVFLSYFPHPRACESVSYMSFSVKTLLWHKNASGNTDSHTHIHKYITTPVWV